MITLAPISVAASGLIPERIAGTMKRTITRKLATRPTSDPTPRQRPTSTTAAANTAPSSQSGTVRSRSAMK